MKESTKIHAPPPPPLVSILKCNNRYCKPRVIPKLLTVFHIFQLLFHQT